MGNDASTSRPSEERTTNQRTPQAQAQSRTQFSETEVAELLERQKQHFEKKQQQLLKTQQELRATQLRTPNVAGSSNNPHANSSSVASAISNVERSRTPYSYSQSQLNQATGQTLYPNLNTVQYQNQSNIHPSTSSVDSREYLIFMNSRNIERSMPAPSAPPAPRDRSTSRPQRDIRNKNNDNEMNCPTCKNAYGLTIFQCPGGHSSCNKCKQFRRACGLCYQPITDMRNITLEAIISEMKVNCIYSEDGCHLFIKKADLENHAKECPFREMPCPLNSTFGCLWKGKLSQIECHFDNTHPINRQGAVDTEMTVFNLKNNSHIAQLVVLGSFNFIFHLIVSQSTEKMYMVVQLIGTNVSASKWTYEVHVYHKGRPRRKYQHVDVCQPINTNINDIMSESQCAVLSLSYASTFAFDNKLTYKFYIKKEYNERPFGRNNRGRGGPRR